MLNQKLQLLQKIMELLNRVLVLLKKKRELLEKQKKIQAITDKNEIVYQTAKSLLGQKLRTVNKELACAEVVNNVYIKATGKPVGGTISTLRMYNTLRKSKDFEEVKDYKRGYLIISPSGFKRFWSRVEHGHCGIFGENGIIFSNNSDTGLLDNHLTIEEWRNYYGKEGGYLVKIFRLK